MLWMQSTNYLSQKKGIDWQGNQQTPGPILPLSALFASALWAERGKPGPVAMLSNAGAVRAVVGLR